MHRQRSSASVFFGITASGAAAGLAALLASMLTACGGGGSGIDFPAQTATPAQATDQRKATAAQATEATQPLRQLVAQAVAQGVPLATVQSSPALTLPAGAITLPSGGSITAVRLEYGGTIVADISLPDLPAPAPAASAASAPAPTPPPQVIETAKPPSTPGRAQLVWVAYPVAAGVVRWYCFGSYAGVEKDTDGACLYPGDAARGMTWATGNGAGVPAYDERYNISLAECNVTSPPTKGRSGADQACDPYVGDWHVLRKLPLLCVKKTNKPAPAGWFPANFIRPYVGGDMALTEPVYGVQLLGVVPGNALCAEQFGAGWTMAAFHDAGGWGFFGSGKLATDTRYWVRIRDQSSNPWCATLTGLPCVGN
jgi:hypothetical protein